MATPKRKPRLGLFGASCVLALCLRRGAVVGPDERRGLRHGGHQSRHADAEGRTQDLPLRDVRQRGLLGRHAGTAQGHRRRQEWRRRPRRLAQSGPRRRPQGRRRRAARGVEGADQGRQGQSRRSGDDDCAPQGERRGRRDGFCQSQRQRQVDGHPVRVLPLHRRQFLRARHRQAARRLGQPRSQRRRHRVAGAQPEALHRPPGRRYRDGEEGLGQLGSRPLRRRARQGRQGLPARREAGGNADPACVRPGGRQPRDLDGLRLGHLLERLCRGHADAWCCDVLRPPLQQQGAVSRVGQERRGQHAQ